MQKCYVVHMENTSDVIAPLGFNEQQAYKLAKKLKPNDEIAGHHIAWWHDLTTEEQAEAEQNLLVSI